MRLHFTKMHGAGNDFVIVDARQARPADGGAALDAAAQPADFFRHIADRREGVGCDQVLVLEDARGDAAVASYRVYNADGGEVQQCGNGARCLARYLADSGIAAPRFAMQSAGGVVEARIDGERVAISLGVPRFEPSALPLRVEQRQPTYTVDIDGRELRFRAVSMGNPHAVIEVDDTEKAPVAEVGAALNDHPLFPEGVNAGFCHIDSRSRLLLRVYERGVGETRACGT
ncbi:MAG: diaminopimelate epimerase, partial [Pseudomonadota bacterium]